MLAYAETSCEGLFSNTADLDVIYVLIHFCGVQRFQWKRYSLRELIPRNVPPRWVIL